MLHDLPETSVQGPARAKVDRKGRKSLPTENAQQRSSGCRIVYVSPLKALAVDVDATFARPNWHCQHGSAQECALPRSDDKRPYWRHSPKRTSSASGANPADILITTPESLYLLLTSQAADALRTVDTVIIDEIHALVPTKQGAHLALTLERLEALTKHPLQRIGLSATQRPLEEVARFLGGVEVAESPLLAKRQAVESTGDGSPPFDRNS